MVSLKHIQQANASLSPKPKTAVFVGATSGIGLAAIEALLTSIPGCRVFIVGRSQSKFANSLSRLQGADTQADITFIEAQISLLKEVKRVCAVILEQTSSLDILWLSQGGLGLREGQSSTSEGLPMDFAVTHYGRLLFMQQFAPLLSKSSDGRVLSVLCAGVEGPVNLTDLGLQDASNYAAAGFWGAQKQCVTMQSLAMHQLAIQYPSVTYVHTNPGPVSTDVHAKWSESFTGAWAPVAWLMRLIMVPLMHLISYTPKQAGETGLFEFTSERLSRQSGNNFFRLDDHAEEIKFDGRDMLQKYQQDGSDQKIWEHTLQVFDSVLRT